MTETRSYRLVTASLSTVLGLHLLALLVGWLLMSPGTDLDLPLLERAGWVDRHRLVWRLGWLVWMAGGLTTAAMAAALAFHLHRRIGGIRADRMARNWGLAAVAFAVLALIPDLWGEWLAITDLVDSAHQQADGFGGLERRIADLTDGKANPAWLGMIWCLTMSLATQAGGWRRRGRFLGWGVATILLLLLAHGAEGEALRALGPDGATTAENCVGFWKLLAFVAWMGWLGGAAILLGQDHHDRFPADDAAEQRFQWPVGSLAEYAAPLADEPGLRDLLRPLVPRYPTLRSDLTDVVQVSWLLPAERLAPLLPPPLKLATLSGDKAVLTLLVFRHGHLGPERLGGLRQRLPSPRACEIRLQVRTGAAGVPTDAVWLYRAVMDSPLHVTGSRLLSDGLPAHLPATFEHRRDGEGWWTSIQPGASKAPDLRLRVTETKHPEIPEGWSGRFGDWEDLVYNLVDKSRALRVSPAADRIYETRVRISFRFEEAIPAVVETFDCDLLDRLVEGCPCVAFVLPTVTWRVESEHGLPL